MTQDMRKAVALSIGFHILLLLFFLFYRFVLATPQDLNQIEYLEIVTPHFETKNISAAPMSINSLEADKMTYRPNVSDEPSGKVVYAPKSEVGPGLAVPEGSLTNYSPSIATGVSEGQNAPYELPNALQSFLGTGGDGNMFYDLSFHRRLLHEVKPVEPREAITADVTLEFTVNPDGAVVDVKVLKTVSTLGDLVVTAVRQWRFEKITQNELQKGQVTFHFKPRRQ